MKEFVIPTLGGTECVKNRLNATAEVVRLAGADNDLLDRYRAYFIAEGFAEKESRSATAHRYVALARGEDAVFLNYFENTAELTVVTEENCRYFAFEDACGAPTVAPQITQIALEDFGMSYVIRLSDGRFIVIDGGREFEPDATKLYRCLCSGAGQKKPVIAAWIFSHPHSDHFYCYLKFAELYGDQVILEKVLYHFPSRDDVAHYPKLMTQEQLAKKNAPFDKIPLMQECVANMGAETYMPHTGQIYRIGDAVCEILSSMEDTIHCSDNINATSLVIRMELGGQVILFTTDASFSIARLPQRYGNYLKADILQVPHHGFQSGTAEGEIAGYDLIDPAVCFLPVSDYHAFSSFCTFRKGTNYLMRKPAVQEMITGSTERTITLPYHPLPDAKEALHRAYLWGRDNSGACTWIFSDLNTAFAEDLTFTLLNTTYLGATVRIDLYFEDKAQNVELIQATVSARSLKTVSLIGDEVETETRFYNPFSRDKQGIPENKPFAVRFLSDIPIVVTNQNHKAAYTSSNNF